MEHTQCHISPKDHISPLRAFCLCFSPSLQSFWRIFNSLLDCSKKKDLGPITEVVSRAMHVDGEKLSHSIEECFEKWENTLLLNFEDKVTFTQIHWRCCVKWKGWRCKVRAALVSGLWNNKELERSGQCCRSTILEYLEAGVSTQKRVASWSRWRWLRVARWRWLPGSRATEAAARHLYRPPTISTPRHWLIHSLISYDMITM